ncbi:hypothetical protein [Flavobacterium aestivum]|uniref:hypothetical protein n=1 Tax=Flavobacterium aestivum TaxID=3003257 RepID=UPI002285CEAF|nr:hypothetical protein [Flavobacterium aestivum]
MIKSKIVFFAVFFLSSLSVAFAQKVDFGSNYISMNQTEWLKFGPDNSYDDALNLLNDEGQPIILIRFLSSVNVDLQSEINPEGIIYYANVKFLSLNKEFEIQDDKNNVLALLFRSNVVNVDKTLNVSNVNSLKGKFTQLFSNK